MSEPAKILSFTFPSGRGITIGLPIVGDGNPKWKANKGRGACKHIGEAIDVKTGCSGMKAESTFHCDLLQLECAPLAGIVFNKPGVTLCRMCDHWMPAEEPGWAKLGKNFFSAVARWIKAGRPTRTQEKVNELFAICQSCPHLVRTQHGAHCGKCGCPVSNRIDKPTKNKLAMASEECPIGLWKADV